MQLDRPGPISGAPLTRVDVPPVPPARLSAGEIEIAADACGVCRTDLQLCEGDLTARSLPIVPGHQIVGRVVRVADDVAHRAVGDRVGVAWIAGTCGTCRFCTTDRENLCESAEFTGWDRDGGYADLVTARAEFTYSLPDDGPGDADLAPLLCGGAIGYRALRLTGIDSGGRLGLYGFGASATSVIQMARHQGCEVFVATRSPPEQERARRLGAVWAGPYDESPPVPLDAAITFAPVGDVVVAALRATDRGGTVVINAIHLDRIPEFSYDLLWWERSIRSVANVTRADVEGALRLAREIPILTDIQTYPVAEANTALGDLEAGDVSGAAVLVSD
ncbi:MAG: zinc-dependent alcohol dehydrogenase family protein [Ilumatobacteraceae bacterium]